jgi:hypothetical protein
MGITRNIQNNIVVIYEIMFLCNLGSREILHRVNNHFTHSKKLK